MTALIDSQGAYFLKRASEILDFSIDWSDVLELGETISTSTWTVPNGITRDSDGISGQLTIAWIKSGTAGLEYVLGNTIVTSGSRTLNRDLRIKVIPTAEPSDNLISLAYLKTIMGKSDADPESDSENPLLLGLIQSASDEIKSICGRNFFKAVYKERVNVYGPVAFLKEFPIDYLAGTCLSLRDGILLENAASDAVAAHAYIKNGHLYLRVIGGLQAGLIDLDLSAAANDTLGELVSIINGGSSGWSATLADGLTGYEPSDDLIDLPPETIWAGGSYLKIMGTDEVDLSEIDYDSGLVRFSSSNNHDLWIKYSAGYTAIPAELKLLTARWVIKIYHESKADPSIIQEKIGDYFYIRSASKSGIQEALESQLLRWKRSQI